MCLFQVPLLRERLASDLTHVRLDVLVHSRVVQKIPRTGELHVAATVFSDVRRLRAHRLRVHNFLLDEVEPFEHAQVQAVSAFKALASETRDVVT